MAELLQSQEIYEPIMDDQSIYIFSANSCLPLSPPRTGEGDQEPDLLVAQLSILGN